MSLVKLKFNHMIRECKYHGETKHNPRREQGNVVGYRCGKCQGEAVNRRHTKMKEILVDEHGGSCVVCGYDKCIKALQFHHMDPSNKLRKISGGSIGLSRLREEASKCVLLCGNCHVEVEYGVTELRTAGVNG